MQLNVSDLRLLFDDFIFHIHYELLSMNEASVINR